MCVKSLYTAIIKLITYFVEDTFLMFVNLSFTNHGHRVGIFNYCNVYTNYLRLYILSYLFENICVLDTYQRISVETRKGRSYQSLVFTFNLTELF